MSAQAGTADTSILRRLPLLTLAGWLAGVLAAFGVAFALGWATAPKQSPTHAAVPLRDGAKPTPAARTLGRAAPLPPLRRAAPKKRPRRVAPPAPQPPAPAPISRPGPPPPPSPVIIVGKG